MKYMLIMRSTDEAEEAFANVDFQEAMDAMGRYNAELISAGVLVAAEGLDDAPKGVVVDYSSTPPVVTRRPLRRDQGAVRRVLDPRRRFPG